jgi:nitrogenase-associated protein
VTSIVFFEKPGCQGHARQRKLLRSSGHSLVQRNLLTTHWTHASLLEFLGQLPVSAWFNRAAPRVRSGEIQPATLTADAAMALLLAEPLLIRRPLMQRADDLSRHVGFDHAAVHAWVGLGTTPEGPTLEHCTSTGAHCATPAEFHGDPHALV